MAKAKTAVRADGAGGNLLHVTFSLAVMAAADTLDLNVVAKLLRDPRVPVSQSDREALAELLVPVQRGAKARGKLVGRAGRSSALGRNVAFYEALQVYRIEHGTDRIPAAVKAEIAARFKIDDMETAKKAEANGRRRLKQERLGRTVEDD